MYYANGTMKNRVWIYVKKSFTEMRGEAGSKPGLSVSRSSESRSLDPQVRRPLSQGPSSDERDTERPSLLPGSSLYLSKELFLSISNII